MAKEPFELLTEREKEIYAAEMLALQGSALAEESARHAVILQRTAFVKSRDRCGYDHANAKKSRKVPTNIEAIRAACEAQAALEIANVRTGRWLPSDRRKAWMTIALHMALGAKWADVALGAPNSNRASSAAAKHRDMWESCRVFVATLKVEWSQP